MDLISLRLKALREVLASLHLDGFLASRRSSVRYLTGFSGTSGICLITPDEAVFVTDFRYKEQVKQELRGFRAAIAGRTLLEELRKLEVLKSGQKIGFEAEDITVAVFEKMRSVFPQVAWEAQEKLIENLAIVKQEEEIERLREAARLADRIFEELLPMLRPGVQEREIAAEILARGKRYGAERASFEPIVASGERSALPHGFASARELQPGDLLVLDFGCVVDGYASDSTRTVGIGRLDARKREIYQVVLRAQRAAIGRVRPEIPCQELDAVARDIIREAGYGDYFGHSLGHGLGLSVHMEPRIGPGNPKPIPEHAAITIEPGIYLPGIGGVRIEDDLVVRSGGAERLSQSSTDLLELT